MAQVKQAFYDIESLNNVFSLCNFKYNENELDVYILCDDVLDLELQTPTFEITDDIKDYINQRIYKKNKNFNGKINYFNLHDYKDNIHLITTFGAKDVTGSFEALTAADPDFKMFVNDTDVGYSNQNDAYLMGYNSFNYDTTILALYINETFWINNKRLMFSPPTARTMRDYNNDLFTAKYKARMPSYLQKTNDNGTNYNNRQNIIRNNMLKSGRHIDVAQLNEKMQKVGFKRVLGMLGFQILESEKLDNNTADIHTLDELADLIAYNASDVINLRELFIHPVYQGNFELKKGLLESYPELIYNQKEIVDENGQKTMLYAPDIRPDNVRKDRLYIDSSSAKLAARTLCPYGTLNDRETVSFMYPSEIKAKELGIPRINVLDECKKFFYGLYATTHPELLPEFDRIYDYYKNNIEGRNFNDSDEYANYWQSKNANHTSLPAYSMSEIPKANLTLPYFNQDGSLSNCYVAFGVGGIHGAEYNQELYNADLAEYNAMETLYNLVHTQFADPLTLKQKDPATKKAWSFTYDNITYKASDFLKTGSTAKKAEWKDISKKKPVLFKEKGKGGYELNKKYTFTSAADCNHEDFTSYYPNLLIMMMAFWNDGLGYDRYAEIFEDKQKYGRLMKDKTITSEERNRYDILRNGTKLILNSASGAADAAFFTPIRMNNQIMSMRIIGQLFTWRIGQAQTYAGARIISTNTDGLFSVCEPIRNAEILERESKNIHVEIEPEFCRLVSKDSNNRIEIDEKGKIITASGGSLACYKRPNPTKSLAHAAIIDWILCEYLRNVDNIHGDSDFMSQPFDLDKGRVILYNARFAFKDLAHYLNMFQTIIASSIGSQTFIYGETDNLQGYKNVISTIPFNQDLFDAACTSDDIKIMLHYNRVFFVTDEFKTQYNKPVYMLRNAATRVVTPAQKLTRSRNNELAIQHDEYALALLRKYNIGINDIEFGKEAKISKVSGIDLDWHVYIENHSLFELSDDEKQIIINGLDMEKYLQLAADSFNKNWQNTTNRDASDDSETGDDV